MKFTGVFFLLLINNLAHAEIVQFVRPDGARIARHIVHEPQANGRTLVLIVDEIPGNDSLLPQVIFRRSFAASERLEMDRILTSAPAMKPLRSQILKRTDNPLWPIDHSWTLQDEADYAKWLSSNASEDFLVGSGVPVDCADYAIVLRWIYAHDHHLPAGNQIESGRLMGSWQSTEEWDALPANSDWRQDERFKAALQYLFKATYTHTLINDLYPVKIDTQFVSPGALYLTITGESGHTRTIYSMGGGASCGGADPCISVIWGNEPASEYGFMSELVPYRLDSTEGGFMRFRWPELTAQGWQLRAVGDMPGYSMEQYEWSDEEYFVNLANNLHLYNTAERRFLATGSAAIGFLQERVQVTERGYFLCALVPCMPDDQDYRNWSTPVRDQNLLKAVHNFQAAIADVDPNSSTATQFYQAHTELLFPESPWMVTDFLSENAVSEFSSDPTQDLLTRWGITIGGDNLQLGFLAQSLTDNWQWREGLVDQAMQLCFPNGGVTPVCDLNNPAVMALATDRLDQAFRLGEAKFMSLYGGAQSSLQTEIVDYLQSQPIAEKGCLEAGTPCTMYDLVIGQPQHFQNMTSSPLDPRQKRVGF